MRAAAIAAFVLACSAAHADPAQVERGRYLALVGDCTSCHTAKGGQPYAGGFAVDTGFGTIYAPNITPDRETGIGSWSGDDFYRALHAGRDDEGSYLYPAFPYPWFTKVTRADVDALKAFLDTLTPVRQADKPPKLPWFMSWRPSLMGWNLLNFDKGEFQPDRTKSAQWNRGAYLVEGLGHCGDCHTEKRFFGGTDKDRKLAGGYTKGGHDNGWFASALTAEERGGLRDWSVDDIVSYLKTGSNARTAAAGPMVEVVENSTRHLTDADLTAIAVYLKSQPARDEPTSVQALGRPAIERGQALFTDNCAACHMHDGNGIPHLFPALAGSSALQAREPATVLRVVLGGAQVPARPGQRAYIAMPAFGDKFDDGDVAAIVSYVRHAWENHASAVDTDAVAKARAALAKGEQ